MKVVLPFDVIREMVFIFIFFIYLFIFYVGYLNSEMKLRFNDLLLMRIEKLGDCYTDWLILVFDLIGYF